MYSIFFFYFDHSPEFWVGEYQQPGKEGKENEEGKKKKGKGMRGKEKERKGKIKFSF